MTCFERQKEKNFKRRSLCFFYSSGSQPEIRGDQVGVHENYTDNSVIYIYIHTKLPPFAKKDLKEKGYLHKMKENV